ncbi:MAG TPA: NUDIX hydrolase [Pseudonocardiaceae bacterium]
MPRETAPWRRVSSSLVHANPWFEVRTDQVIRPDGTGGVYERVDSRGSVTVLALDVDDAVVFTRQWIYLHDATQWRLPGGGIDADDPDPLTAARRELAEETGLRAATWQSLGSINCADSLTNHVAHLFLATDLIQGEADVQPGEEDLRVVRLPFDDAVDLVLRHEVPDAASAHALMLYAARRAGIGRPAAS